MNIVLNSMLVHIVSSTANPIINGKHFKAQMTTSFKKQYGRKEIFFDHLAPGYRVQEGVKLTEDALCIHTDDSIKVIKSSDLIEALSNKDRTIDFGEPIEIIDYSSNESLTFMFIKPTASCIELAFGLFVNNTCVDSEFTPQPVRDTMARLDIKNQNEQGQYGYDTSKLALYAAFNLQHELDLNFSKHHYIVTTEIVQR
ncbi:hypothetical protein IB292_02455 [Vibrio parahaemolyticus]|uniref:Uncharacterized protein n=2 Tax=Vibrio harveyi group TaxID=717610 RepID=A0A9Q3UBQ5_VIBPH|nr:hypothetical protein [Vibrio parahaemolyticus]ELA8176459.1 hypothetical protein [Vibrio alginolyticus]MCC3803890.1 hypothetical protein [Vibrio parahaemolyticus]CAH1592801.1 hypothetical protein THF1C08_320058 [Vibrio jasicida]CAH1597454.1 hypothetical protein THF1A12_320058 [Vibrio jasicida]